MTKFLLAITLSAVAWARVAAYEQPLSSVPAEILLEIELVDAAGRPVEGAHVEVGTVPDGTGKNRSDDSGKIRVPFHTSRTGLCLVARHAGRKLMGITPLESPVPRQPLPMKLAAECEVVANVTCSERAARGHQLAWIVVEATKDGKRAVRSMIKSSTIRLPFPPGDYELTMRGFETFDATQTLRVAAVGGAQDLGEIDLLATNLARLEGQPAPEIPGVVGWKNERPGKLADLRGKVVLLDFWGYWCGPCVADMPRLFALHDKYRDRGLVVIGVHVDLREMGEAPVNTPAEFDERVRASRRELWQDRDVPFPVALVAMKRTPFRNGVKELSGSAATAVYGISAVPTQVLIGRQGTVVGRFTHSDEGIRQLEELLDAP